MKLSGLVGASASPLGARFGLVGILPTTLLVLFVLALVWGGAPANAPTLHAAFTTIAQFDTAQGLFLVIAILALAIILQPFQPLLVRFLEGYWGISGPGAAFGEVFAKRHGEKRRRLQDKLENILQSAQYHSSPGVNPAPTAEAGRLSSQIERFYPKGRLLPTTLGNVLRAAEERAGVDYGLDVITIWPRLYLILPERTAAMVNDQRNQLDLAIRFCITFGAATVVSAGLLYQHGWWLLVPVAAFALAWMSYQGAIASALAYGLGIRAAVDLHRFDLLRALHLPLPDNREIEKQANATLSAFLRQGRPVNFYYDHSPDKVSRPLMLPKM